MSRSRRAIRRAGGLAPPRRRAPRRRQQSHLRRHQVPHPVHLVACGALCRPARRAHRRDGEPHTLIEAELGIGVDSAPLSKYSRFHTRVCRPAGLTIEDREKVCAYAIERIGLDYDLKNITDLMRYLMPLPVPRRWRRRVLALGSSDSTRIICSALIAQAFESVRYPILPKVTRTESRAARRELLEIRHSSLYTPRDFDISPYFSVGEADHRERLRLHAAALGRPAAAAGRGRAAVGRGRRRDAGAAARDAPPAPLRDGLDLIRSGAR